MKCKKSDNSKNIYFMIILYSFIGTLILKADVYKMGQNIIM